MLMVLDYMEQVFKNKAPPEAIDLLSVILAYSPAIKVNGYQYMQTSSLVN